MNKVTISLQISISKERFFCRVARTQVYNPRDMRIECKYETMKKTILKKDEVSNIEQLNDETSAAAK